MSNPPLPFARMRDRLRLPLIAAPMFLVSDVDLVSAACRNGVVGAFPTANCRSSEELAHWLAAIAQNLRGHEETTSTAAAPFCPNLIVHASNPRLEDDLAVVCSYAPQIVITSVGSPAAVIAPLHDAGWRTLALDRRLQRQTVHDGREHAHGVAGRPLHAARGDIHAADHVAAADHHGDLGAELLRRDQIGGDTVDDRLV